jgi:hypothetical protein
MIAMDTYEKGSRIREARWALANEIRMARNVNRAMLRRANDLEPSDWRLAAAYRHEAIGHQHVIEALRRVSRALRGI